MTPKLTEGLELKHPKAMMLRSAATLALDLKNTSILLFTRSGYLPRMIASLRPNKVPIFAFTDVPHIFKSMLIQWGIEPFLIEFDDENPEKTVQNAIDFLKSKKWVKEGEYVVTMTNVFTRGSTIESIQLRSLQDLA
jgi:pyruvate kinase